jgi:hypothetical protein
VEAVPALTAALLDQEAAVRWRAAWALEVLRPDADEASRSVEAFLAGQAVDLARLASAGQAGTFRGDEGPLILALERHGTREMAAGLLGSGNPRLRAAAERWARMRGYEISRAEAPVRNAAPPPKKRRAARPPKR